MLKLNSITKKYKLNTVLNGINLNINNGDFITIFGKSGSGKTTLLNIIGLIDDYEGDYYINDVNISELNDFQKAKFRNKMFGYIFQNYYIEPNYTVYENIEIPLIISKKKDYKKKILDIIEYVGLEGKEKQKCGTLSGGEMQRVAIARALVNDAEIIIADEPTGALDSTNSKIIMDLLIKLNNEGKTIILVTHNIEQARLSKRIITLVDGKIDNDEII